MHYDGDSEYGLAIVHPSLKDFWKRDPDDPRPREYLEKEYFPMARVFALTDVVMDTTSDRHVQMLIESLAEALWNRQQGIRTRR